MFQKKQDEGTPRTMGRPVEAPTTIGREVSFAGGVCGRGDVEVFGTLEGPLRVDGRVRVREGGRCLGDIEAREVAVEGEVRGDIRALDKAQLSSTACVLGKLQAPRLSIGEGARLEGTVVMAEGHPAGKPLTPAPAASEEENRSAMTL